MVWGRTKRAFLTWVFGVLFCRGDEMSFVGRKRVYNFIYIHTHTNIFTWVGMDLLLVLSKGALTVTWY